MASSSGKSSGSGTKQRQNLGSETEETHQLQQQQLLMEQRKRKRMQSNRESARRSRMRKQNHLNELMAQVDQLRKDNNQILSKINITTHHYLNVEAENSVLRAQLMELTHRLDSLNDILSVINHNANNNAASSGTNSSDLVFESDDNEVVGGISGSGSGSDSGYCFVDDDEHNSNNPFDDLIYLNQQIMSSPDLLSSENLSKYVAMQFRSN